jgi:hypothetical protein
MNVWCEDAVSVGEQVEWCGARDIREWTDHEHDETPVLWVQARSASTVPFSGEWIHADENSDIARNRRVRKLQQQEVT